MEKTGEGIGDVEGEIQIRSVFLADGIGKLFEARIGVGSAETGVTVEVVEGETSRNGGQIVAIFIEVGD